MEMVFKNFGFFMHIHIITDLHHLYFYLQQLILSFLLFQLNFCLEKLCMAENHSYNFYGEMVKRFHI